MAARKTTPRKAGTFNRRQEDVGNILLLEHVNVTVPDQGLATLFYVSGLGLTRDPYIDFGTFNVWINAGEQQFHLPTNTPQVLRGQIGLVLPDLDDLEKRLSRVATHLAGTRFGFTRRKQFIDVICPYGNRIRCHGPKEFGMSLGIPYLELHVPGGASAGIGRFYNEIMKAPATVSKGLCTVRVGTSQFLRYKETDRQLPPYDGHHIAVYIADFSGPYDALRMRGFVSEESDAHQYRFKTLFDPKSGKELFELEHEVRSLHHPMFRRHLTNRNPAQSFATYTRGHDAFVG